MIRVRDLFPNLSYLPIIPNLRDSETNFCDIADLNTSSSLQGFDKNVLLVDSKFSSPKASDTSLLKQSNAKIRSYTEPIVKISPPTPLKKSPKTESVAITEIVEEHMLTAVKNKLTKEKVNPCEELESFDIPSKNSIMPHDGLGNGKVYSKKTCPFHKHEPAVKIFDDDIEKYLSDDPRASMLLEQKWNKLPLLPKTSNSLSKSKRTSAKNRKIKKNDFPQKGLEYYPDNVIDLAATEIAKIKSKTKENDTLNKHRSLKSDVLIPNLKFSVDKESLFPKLYHSQDRIILESDKSIAKSSKSQKYLRAFRIQENFINKSE